MARPVLTANSPAAGYIAWTTFGIQYAGVSRQIAAGSTAKRYAYWLWNDGNPASSLTTADVLPANLGPDDLVLFVNRSGIPVNVQSANVIEGSLIATESIIGSSLQADTVDADRLKADTITSRELRAGAVTATELSISSLGGLAAVNGDMEDVDPTTKVPAGWTAGFERSGTAPTYSQETMSPLSGSTSVAITLAANSVEGMAAKATPVKAGDRIMFGCAFRTSVTGVPITLRAYFSAVDAFNREQLISTTPAAPENVYTFDVTAQGMVPRDDIATPVTGPGIAAMMDGWLTPVTTALYVTGQLTVPSGARFVRFMLGSGLMSGSPAHTTIWDALEYAPLVTGVRIADGAIDGRVITGAFIRTAAEGSRWELSGEGQGVEAKQWLRAYSGMPDETSPGGLESSIIAIDAAGNGTRGAVRLFSPDRDSGGVSSLILDSGGYTLNADGTVGAMGPRSMQLDTTNFRLDAVEEVTDGGAEISLGVNNTSSTTAGQGSSWLWLYNHEIVGTTESFDGKASLGVNNADLSLSAALTLAPNSLSLTQGDNGVLTMGGDTTKLIGGTGKSSEIDLWSGGTINIVSGANLHMGPRSGLGNIYLKTQYAWVGPDAAAGADMNSSTALIIGGYNAGQFGEPSLRIRRRTSDDLTSTEAYTYVASGTGSAVTTQLRRGGAVQSNFTQMTDRFTFDKALVCQPMRPKDTGTISYVHTTTSTTEVDNTGGPQLTFVAPPSGMVKFLVSCYPKAGADGKLAEVGIRVRTGATMGSGTQVGFEYIASSYVGQYNRIAGFATVDGLTPGATYNARLTLRTNDAAYAASNSQSRILVEACA